MKGDYFHLYGDCNNDEIIDINDLLLLIDYIFGNIKFRRADDVYADEFKYADVNHDRKIDIKDVMVLIDIIFGKKPPERIFTWFPRHNVTYYYL